MQLTLPMFAVRTPMGGIESSIYNFARALLAAGSDLTVALGNEGYLAPEFISWLQAQPIAVDRYPSFGPGTSRRFFEESWFAMRQRADRVVYPNYFLPPLHRKGSFKGVVIHDIQFKSFPEYFSARKRFWLDTVFHSVRKNADSFMFVSEFERQQFFRYYGDSFADRTHVIQVPIDWARYNGEPREEIRHRMSRRYILSVSHSYPHKNVETLISAFAILGKVDRNLELFLVGKPAANLQALAASLDPEIRSRIWFAGVISDADLGALYRSASIFATPSRYEGFGMPAVEALGFGIPTVVSDAGSLREATRGRATYLHAYASPDEWAEALRSLDGKAGSTEIAAEIRQAYAPITIGNRILKAMS